MVFQWYIIDSRYITVIYDTIVQTAQQIQWYTNDTHILPLQERYGVSFASYYTKKIIAKYRDII